MGCQPLQDNTVGDRGKGFADVYVDSLSLIFQTGHLVIEGDEVGQGGVVLKPLAIVFYKSWLSGDVPGNWKNGNIPPVLKKGRKDFEL